MIYLNKTRDSKVDSTHLFTVFAKKTSWLQQPKINQKRFYCRNYNHIYIILIFIVFLLPFFLSYIRVFVLLDEMRPTAQLRSMSTQALPGWWLELDMLLGCWQPSGYITRLSHLFRRWWLLRLAALWNTVLYIENAIRVTYVYDLLPIFKNTIIHTLVQLLWIVLLFQYLLHDYLWLVDLEYNLKYANYSIVHGKCIVFTILIM